MIEYEICICIALTLIIQKDLKVCLVKLHNLTQTEMQEWNCIEPLSTKMLSVLFLSMRRYQVLIVIESGPKVEELRVIQKVHRVCFDICIHSILF